MAWGTYRLTLTDPKSGASSSYRYYSGWAASSAGDRPDRIPVAADKPSYRAGETAHVRIKPTADGKALVVVAVRQGVLFASGRCAGRRHDRRYSRVAPIGARAPMCW